MAVTFLNSAKANSGTQNPKTVTLDCKDGLRRCVVLGIQIRSATARAGGAPTCGGTSMTQIGSTVTGTGVSVELWQLTSPGVGSLSISVPNSDGLTMALTATVWDGVDASSPVDVSGGTTGSGTNPSHVITTTEICGVVSFLCHESDSISSATSDTTLYITDEGVWNTASAYAIQSGAGDETISYTHASSDQWAIAMVGLAPADFLGAAGLASTIFAETLEIHGLISTIFAETLEVHGLVVTLWGSESSTSPSISPSKSPSISPSKSPSLSQSASPSLSPSASPSTSPSISPSQSPSISPSVSPSADAASYTRGDYAALPANDDDLETAYSAQDIIDVGTDDGVRVDQDAAGEYAIHQYKEVVVSARGVSVLCDLQSSLAPSSSAVVLQVYNYNSAMWETLTQNNTANADTDFQLSASVTENVSDYKDGNIMTFRVYQLGI